MRASLVKIAKRLINATLLSYSLVFLTGCPGYGDRSFTDVEAVVSMIEKNICFWVKDSEEYKPGIITITRRGADFGNEKIHAKPTAHSS